MPKIGVSQNGWPVYDDGTFRDHYVRIEVPQIASPMWAANADVALCLAEWAAQFAARIERLDMPVRESPGYDDWSRALRAVRGQTEGYSNHASCTAWDLNATQHPRGVKGTFTAAELAELRAMIREISDDDGDPVLRCGEFYTGTVDGMHIEVNASPARIRQAANKIRARWREEEDMDLEDPIKLGKTSADIYGVPNGSTRTVRETLLYPAGVERLRQELAGSLKALTAQVRALAAGQNTILTAVRAVATGSPDAVREAFDDGVEHIRAELADIDVRVVIGGDDETPATAGTANPGA